MALRLDYLVREVDFSAGVAHFVCLGSDGSSGIPLSLPLSLFAVGKEGQYAEGEELDALIQTHLMQEYRARIHEDVGSVSFISFPSQEKRSTALPFEPVRGSDVYLIRSLNKVSQLPIPVEDF